MLIQRHSTISTTHSHTRPQLSRTAVSGNVETNSDDASERVLRRGRRDVFTQSIEMRWSCTWHDSQDRSDASRHASCGCSRRNSWQHFVGDCLAATLHRRQDVVCCLPRSAVHQRSCLPVSSKYFHLQLIPFHQCRRRQLVVSSK